ncbi:Protein of unknown function [Cotesia congregata]|uniref:Uncharacterized protein n=1 Tax=Cotesia congregata TaxID=51543 RepID=A0A8J2MKF4_COTCN|nr:Protein of unknown function [Cotesia congregata]
MSDQIDKFCLVQNGKDGWIVETKFVFKLGTDGNPVPIDLNEEEDQICFVKTDTRQINNVVVVGSSVEHDEDSESNVNPRRRTVPSPPIRNDTFERVRARSARLSGTGSSSGNNGRRSRRVNSVIRRPLRSRQSLIAKIKSLERSVNSLRKTVRKLLKKVGQGNDNVTQERYPELEQRVIVEGGNEFVEIEGVKIDGEQYAKMLLQNSLRGRANVLMHDMWPDNVMRRMYLKAPPGTQNYEIVKSTDIQKIKNICLYLQRKKKIEYISGGKDDVSIYARNWAGDLFKNCRKKLNDQNVPR